jgi:predicted double-glycine peptidase
MHPLSRGVASAAIGLALAGCFASPSGEATATSGAAVKLPDDTIPVPIVAQQQDYTCGDVATLALLQYWQHATYAGADESSLYAPLHTTRDDGTEPYDIATFVNGIPGMSATYKTATDGTQLADLEAAVDRREPPIVDIQAWRSGDPPWTGDWADGHYAIMIGYDATNLFFMDSSTGGHYGYIARADLAARWHDVVGPDGVATYRMAIFVKGSAPPYTGTPIPPSASAIP